VSPFSRWSLTHVVTEFIQEIPGRVRLHHGSSDCFLRRLRESHSTSARNLPSLSGAKVYKTEDYKRRASSLVQNSRSIGRCAIQQKQKQNHVQTTGKHNDVILLCDKFNPLMPPEYGIPEVFFT